MEHDPRCETADDEKLIAHVAKHGWYVIRVVAKSTQQYSRDPIVKFGFCRGLEPVNYVTHILERFEHYKQFVVNVDRASRNAGSKVGRRDSYENN